MRKNFRKIKTESEQRRYRRKLHIRKTLVGSEACPRLCVVKSNRHLALQVIDDSQGKTLVSVNTFGKNSPVKGTRTIEQAKVVGAHLASKLTEKGIKKVVFDRNGLSFKGTLKVLADEIRANGVTI